MSKFAPWMFHIPALWHGWPPLASLIMKVVPVELGRRHQVLDTKFILSAAAAARKWKSMGGTLKMLLFIRYWLRVTVGLVPKSICLGGGTPSRKAEQRRKPATPSTSLPPVLVPPTAPGNFRLQE